MTYQFHKSVIPTDKLASNALGVLSSSKLQLKCSAETVTVTESIASL